MPSATARPPVPCGPMSPLWPVKHTTSSPMTCISICAVPADCEASTITSAPAAWAMAATRAMSTALPVTLEACVTTTARVPGVTSCSSSS